MDNDDEEDNLYDEEKMNFKTNRRFFKGHRGLGIKKARKNATIQRSEEAENRRGRRGREFRGRGWRGGLRGSLRGGFRGGSRGNVGKGSRGTRFGNRFNSFNEDNFQQGHNITKRRRLRLGRKF